MDLSNAREVATAGGDGRKGESEMAWRKDVSNSALATCA